MVNTEIFTKGWLFLGMMEIIVTLIWIDKDMDVFGGILFAVTLLAALIFFLIDINMKEDD